MISETYSWCVITRVMEPVPLSYSAPAPLTFRLRLLGHDSVAKTTRLRLAPLCYLDRFQFWHRFTPCNQKSNRFLKQFYYISIPAFHLYGFKSHCIVVWPFKKLFSFRIEFVPVPVTRRARLSTNTFCLSWSNLKLHLSEIFTLSCFLLYCLPFGPFILIFIYLYNESAIFLPYIIYCSLMILIYRILDSPVEDC